MDHNLFFILRGIERLIIVGIGGFSIALGYRLFLKIPEIRDSAGKVVFPGGASVIVSRIGPGIFFALFGTAVISIALYMQATKESSIVPDESSNKVSEDIRRLNSKDSTRWSYSTGIETLEDIEELRTERNIAVGDIRVLNDIQKVLARYLEDGHVDIARHKAERADGTISRVKRIVMHSVWDDRWGDYKTFATWVEEGAQEPIPQKAIAAGQLFKKGELPPPIGVSVSK